MLLLYLGQRIGDVLEPHWSAYDGEFMDLVQQKMGEAVSVYCHSALRAELDAGRPEFDRTPMLLTRDDNPLHLHGLIQSIRKVCGVAGLDHLRIHDLRRTAVCNLLVAGVSMDRVCMVTGRSP